MLHNKFCVQLIHCCHNTNLNKFTAGVVSSLVAKLAIVPGQPAAQHIRERSTKFCLAAMTTPEDVLLQFRAGLMKAENNTLKADQRKGLVRLSQVLTTQHSHVVDGCRGYGSHPQV